LKKFIVFSLTLALLLILIPSCAAAQLPLSATTPATVPPAGASNASLTTTVSQAPLPPANASFVVTGVVANVSPANFTGACPKTFTFYATITADGPGTVTYIWEAFDGEYYDQSENQTVAFDQAGTKTVPLQWDLRTSAVGLHRVHVVYPNDLVSVPVYYELNCGSGSLVSGILVGVDKYPFTGTCPKTINFWGTISASGPGTVTYRWERSDGTANPTESVTFTAAGSKTITNLWTRGEGTGWQRLHILTPDDMVSSQIDFVLTCDK
jgi:hypothetical protein